MTKHVDIEARARAACQDAGIEYVAPCRCETEERQRLEKMYDACVHLASADSVLVFFYAMSSDTQPVKGNLRKDIRARDACKDAGVEYQPPRVGEGEKERSGRLKKMKSARKNARKKKKRPNLTPEKRKQEAAWSAKSRKKKRDAELEKAGCPLTSEDQAQLHPLFENSRGQIRAWAEATANILSSYGGSAEVAPAVAIDALVRHEDDETANCEAEGRTATIEDTGGVEGYVSGRDEEILWLAVDDEDDKEAGSTSLGNAATQNISVPLVYQRQSSGDATKQWELNENFWDGIPGLPPDVVRRLKSTCTLKGFELTPLLSYSRTGYRSNRGGTAKTLTGLKFRRKNPLKGVSCEENEFIIDVSCHHDNVPVLKLRR